jgi:ketosteroid isomerase-like protein
MTSPVLTRTPTQTVQAFLDAFARHDIDVAMALVDPQVAVTVHPFGLDESGADVLRNVLADLVRAFPDLVISVSRVITTGGLVTALFKAEARAGPAGAGPWPTWP